jgi:hypothetical protein
MQHPTEAPAIWWDAKARPNLQSLSIRSGIGTPLRQVDMGGKAGDSVTERLGRPSKALLLPAECCLLLKSTIWATFPQWIRCRAPRVFETQTYDDPAVLPLIARDHWEFLETNSAAAIMRAVCPSEWNDIVQVLSTYRLNPESWLKAGGNRGDIAEQIDAEFAKRGWREARLDLETTGILYSKNDVLIDRLPPVRQEGYLVDNYKGRVVVDVEWNAKDGNLDRDLASYRSWHEAGVISAAVIITKDRPRLLTLAPLCQ